MVPHYVQCRRAATRRARVPVQDYPDLPNLHTLYRHVLSLAVMYPHTLYRHVLSLDIYTNDISYDFIHCVSRTPQVLTPVTTHPYFLRKACLSIRNDVYANLPLPSAENTQDRSDGQKSKAVMLLLLVIILLVLWCHRCNNFAAAPKRRARDCCALSSSFAYKPTTCVCVSDSDFWAVAASYTSYAYLPTQ